MVLRSADGLELAAFVTSHFLPARSLQHSDAASRAAARAPGGPCQANVPALLQWTLQTRALALHIASLADERLSVNVFSECLDPAWARTLTV